VLYILDYSTILWVSQINRGTIGKTSILSYRSRSNGVLELFIIWILACDELPSTCSGPEPVEGSRVEFGFWI